jgi:predicted metal-dependent hydrolase
MQFEFRFDSADPLQKTDVGDPLTRSADGGSRGDHGLNPVKGRRLKQDWLSVGARQVPLQMVRHLRARRYVLRLTREGAARVTIPRGGSLAEAKQFVARNTDWLEKQLVRQALRPSGLKPWSLGVEILFHGESVRLRPGPGDKPGVVLFGSETFRVCDIAADLRPAVERQLWRLAARELPRRVAELAALHHLTLRHVTVRNQRTRWGSCSRRAAISLNWRLIQAPAFVSDYIILHELAHLKEMNHSRRFWREVARLCPDFARAEKWLKQHADLLG